MLNYLRSRSISLLWISLPSLLWSLSLQSATLCIDPFIVPAIEKRLSPRFRVLFRWLWAIGFGILLLFAWNIGPGTYSFYFKEALPFTPASVVCGMVFAGLALLWLALVKKPLAPLVKWEDGIAIVGIVLLLVKALAVNNIIYSPAIRQHLRSPVLANTHNLMAAFKPRKIRQVNQAPQATFYSFIKEQQTLSPNVVLMLVESWGETPDAIERMTGEVAGQGFQVLKSGFTSYFGSTLSGEFRELCSMYVQLSGDILNGTADFDCAPKYLRNHGYQAIGLHGYKKVFYARSMFWNRFGFETQIFGDQMANLSQCPGPFVGVCDDDLIRFGVETMDRSDRPTFLYMLTLSSHEPVDTSVLKVQTRHFGKLGVVHPTQVFTRHAISELLDVLHERKSKTCTTVYVVGDHQPPSASAKGGIFKAGKVPYIVFKQNCQ